jgi:xanthine dehydrogenase molybdopterin-binding subunit B
MDLVVKCGILIHQVRELNMYKTIDRTIHKQEFDPRNLIRCWQKCMENSSYYSRKKAVEEFNQQSFWKKRGIAIIPMKFSVGYPKTFYYQVKFSEMLVRLKKNPRAYCKSNSRGCGTDLADLFLWL